MSHYNNQNHQKILILGGSGKIGHTLCQYLGHQDVYCPSHADLDLSKPSQLHRSLDWHRYKAIIYCAGINGRQILNRETEVTEAVNIISPSILAKIAANAQMPFSYISSDDVFDGQLDGPYDEYSTTNPLNRYGEEKYKAECSILSANSNAVIVRLPIVYGGAITQEKHRQFFDKIIFSAMNNRGTWTVSNICITNPSYLADLIPLICQLTLDLKASGIYHLCHSESLSMYDFACEIKSILGSTIDIQPVADAFSTPAYQRKTTVPLISQRLPPLRSCRAALYDYLRTFSLLTKESPLNH